MWYREEGRRPGTVQRHDRYTPIQFQAPATQIVISTLYKDFFQLGTPLISKLYKGIEFPLSWNPNLDLHTLPAGDPYRHLTPSWVPGTLQLR